MDTAVILDHHPALSRITTLSRQLTNSSSTLPIMQLLVDHLTTLIDGPVLLAFFQPLGYVCAPPVLHTAEEDQKILTALKETPTAIQTLQPFYPELHLAYLTLHAEPFGIIGIKKTLHHALHCGHQWEDFLREVSTIALQFMAADNSLLYKAKREKVYSTMISSISHDLKTPLTAIIGACSALDTMGSILDEATRKTLSTTALQEAERLHFFIRNLITMCELEYPNFELHIEPCAPHQFIQSQLQTLQNRLNHHTITFVEENKGMVLAERRLLDLALENLLDNIAKYTPSGTSVILSSHFIMKGEGLTWQLKISDDGPGVAERNLPLLFNKFFRIENTKQKIPGLGLGLHIIQRIVELHHGTLHAAPNIREGTGLIITIELPAASAE